MSDQKRHIFTTDDIVRSVLKETAITGLCGARTTVTREGIGDPSLKRCTKCMAAMPADAHLVVNPTWISLLERWALGQLRSTVTVTVGKSYAWPVAS